jgi:hypothetical protein
VISLRRVSARKEPKRGKQPRIKSADREVVAGFLAVLRKAKQVEARARRLAELAETMGPR